jgi:hypothetical protein
MFIHNLDFAATNIFFEKPFTILINQKSYDYQLVLWTIGASVQ